MSRVKAIVLELEAAEAVKWLRAAGFPQYAQMFEDGQFPVELAVVERDHDFLDKDSLKSLFRRLETLNKHAGMKIDAHSRKKGASEEEDEDDLCALSERWEYQKSVRRWSRKDLTQSPQTTSPRGETPVLGIHSGSHDSLLADQDNESQIDSPLLHSRMPHQEEADEVDGGALSRSQRSEKAGSPDSRSDSSVSPHLRRVSSERVKTTKNIFKKMDTLKSKKTARSSKKNIVEISGPVVSDSANMQAKLERLNCVDISPAQDTGSRVSTREQGSSVDSDSSRSSLKSPLSPTSQPSHTWSPTDSERSHQEPAFRSRVAPGTQSLRPRPASTAVPSTQPSPASRDSRFEEYYNAQSALQTNLQSVPRGGSSAVRKNSSDTNLMEIFLLPQDHQPGSFPRMLQNGYIETEASGTAGNSRVGSIRLSRDTGIPSDNTLSAPQSPDTRKRISLYDNFNLPEGRSAGESDVQSSVIPGVVELGDSGKQEIINRGSGARFASDSGQSDSISEQSDISLVRTIESAFNQESRSSDRERSVSFRSSHRETTPSSERELSTGSEGGTSRQSSSESGRTKGLTYSASTDSYFQEPGHQVGSESSTSSSTLQQEYDEFDQILQQLYQNINDLSRYMGRETSDDRPPRLSSVSFGPTPSSFARESPSPLHVDALTTVPQDSTFDCDSPVSPTSNLASPLSPSAAEESIIDLEGVMDSFQENSSSGGEGSNTAESGSEDQELILTDVSHDDSLDQIPEVSRDRRDSGVGHSLTRAPGERRRKKIRWHSFQRCHRPDINSRAMQVNSLTVGQLVRLQKLSLLKLTGIMEKCLPVNKSGWNWMMPRFMKRHKAPDFSDKNVFGVPFSVMAQRTGQPLPQCVLYAMRYLRRTSHNAIGIFRKSGVKSKIQQLRDDLEAHPDTTDFEGVNAYNVADMLKTYFRDLPECLLTTKMSETFRSIYTHVPQSQRLEAIQSAILLLPDENREVLQSILLFLSDISSHEADHQMNASNLAVCFTPTVFQLGARQMSGYSPKRNRKNAPGIPDPREILEQKAAHECLLMMITECKKLFTVPSNLFRQLQVQSLAHMEPTPLQDIGNSPSEVRAFGQDRIQMVLKEAHDKNRGWVHSMSLNEVEVCHRKPLDDCPLKEWKLVVEIEAPPIEVLRRIMHERHTWDEDLLSWSVMERIDPYSDIFQYVLNSMAPHPSRHYCVLRYWRSDLTKGACALITMSVEPSDAMEVQGVLAVDLGSYFLMEPCGSGRSRLTYITRVDARGRMPEWYTKIFGHICANFLERLKESFKQDTSGPETKV